MANQLFIGCDHGITLTGLTGAGSYLNSATVTYALTDAAGTAISGGTGTLDYTAASNGDYTGTIESTVTALLTEGETYLLTLTIAESAFNDSRRIPLRAYYRRTT